MSLVEVNGTRLFVDDRGDRDAPALVMMHGGPGNPCLDFMASVGGLLAGQLRVIGVDQRGILRSDPLPASPPLSVRLLVADFEALRLALGIGRWTVLGHSAGAAYALDYVLAHPPAVAAAVFDCPAWDLDLTDRHRLPRVASLLEQAGDRQAAEVCRRLAARPGRLTAADESFAAMQALGEDYLDIFFHDRSGRAACESLLAGAENLDWGKSASHLPLLAELYEDRLPRLARLAALGVPSLLIRGESDLVAPPSVVRAFVASGAGRVHTIAGAGHFPFAEQPGEYADAVSAFVLGESRPHS